MNTEQERHKFELWAACHYMWPSSEFYRQDKSESWPGQYGDYAIQCAWEAWQARAAESGCTQSELDELYETLNGMPHVERVTPEVFRMALIRHMREFEARAAECRISTGLCDSDGTEIFVDDKVKMEVTINQEFHGNWAVYEVKQQGLTPMLSYLRSEKGQKLPVGYTVMPLCDCYDRKMFCFTLDLKNLRPDDFLIAAPEWRAGHEH